MWSRYAVKDYGRLMFAVVIWYLKVCYKSKQSFYYTNPIHTNNNVVFFWGFAFGSIPSPYNCANKNLKMVLLKFHKAAFLLQLFSVFLMETSDYI